MSHTSSDGKARIHVISVPCAVHGPHRVIIAGLDDRADSTADFVLAELLANGSPATIERNTISLAEVASGVNLWDI